MATPANLHCDQVVCAAKAGKHVLCEKPLGMTVEEAERMIAACDDNGVKLGTAFMMRFHAQHQEALALVRDGKIGSCRAGTRRFPARGGSSPTRAAAAA